MKTVPDDFESYITEPVNTADVSVDYQWHLK